MVKRALLALTAIAALCTTAGAQTRPGCGTDEVNRQAREMHPEIQVNEQQLEADILRQLHQMDLSKFYKTTGQLTDKMVIPVVVHVIHDYGAENLSDAAIYGMIKRVNDVYLKRNPDTVGIIAPYKGEVPGSANRYIAMSNIEFRLAHRDPQGNPTHGITRRQSPLTYQGGDQAKYDVWPPSNYINIWVIRRFNSNHSTAGAYAIQPATAASIPYYDGLIGLAQQVTDETTVAHELGHLLSLAHPWGNTNNPEISCGDDAVDDTPPTRGHLSCVIEDTCVYATENVGRDADTTTATIVNWPVSNSTTDGVTFNAYTFAQLKTVYVYPNAPLNSHFTVTLLKNGVPVDSRMDSVTTTTGRQLVNLYFNINPGTGYKLVMSVNPGFRRGPTTSTYSRAILGNVTFIGEDTTSNRYPFFYGWVVRHGYYKVYDSQQYYSIYDPSNKAVQIGNNQYLADYPDTTNAQNVMDYAFCSSMMFTHGQAVRMRAALKSSVGGRNNLWSSTNLTLTGVNLPDPDLAPIADFGISRNFVCANNTSATFTSATWNDTVIASGLSWTFSNGGSATTGFSTNQTFTTPGWVTATLTATSNAGSSTITKDHILYVGSEQPISGRGIQEFSGDLSTWPIFAKSGGGRKWTVATGNGLGYYDNTSMSVNNFDTRNGPGTYNDAPDSVSTEFYTPNYNLSDFGTNVPLTLNFVYASATMASDPAQMRDALTIEMSSNCGASFSTLSNLNGVTLANNGTLAIPFAPQYAGDWKSYSVNIPQGSSAGNVMFRFRYTSRVRSGIPDVYFMGNGNNFYMDRLHISDFPLGVDGKVLAEKGMTLAPNPTHEGATVTIKGGDNSIAQLQVLDVAGKVVYSTQVRLSAAATQVQIPADRISAKGMYVVQAVTNGRAITEKLVVY